MCDVKPIGREEAYKTLRDLVLRMDATAKLEAKPETLDESARQFGWAVAIDKLLDALEEVR